MPTKPSHIRTRLYQAVRSQSVQTTTLILSGFLFASPVVAENADNHVQWECRAGADGGWQCGERVVPGRVFPRPAHPEPVEPVPEDDGPQVQLARNLDWVEEEALTEEQRKTMAPGCCGAYVEPPRDYPESELDPADAPLRVASETTEVEQENIAHLRGKVQLTQGYRQVRSQNATVDQNARTVDLDGDVQFREPGLLLTGDHAQVNMDTKDVTIDNATYLLHESRVRGTATQMNRRDEVFYIDNATYTTCEPGSNAWQLVSSKVDINPETGIAHAKHVRLEVKDIPILYAPWLRFPIDDRRASGLLFPSFQFGEENGIDFAQPIYLNLAPNYDATITPRYIQERGPMAEVEFRHLSKLTSTVLGSAFLSDDDGGDDDDEEPDAITGDRNYEGEDRWLVNVDHLGGIGRRWETRVDYTKVSDSDYFRDLDNTTLEVNSQTHLSQLAYAGYRTDNWNFKVTGRKYQTLSDDFDRIKQYKQLPRVDADGNYRFGDFVVNLDNQYTYFDHDDDDSLAPANSYMRDDLGTFVTGQRLRLNYSATWDKQWAWGYFRPTAKVRHLTYDLDDPIAGQNDDSPSVTVPTAIIDAGIYLERDTTWLSGFTQTLEPRIYMVHTKYEDQSDLPDFDTSLMTFSYSQMFRDDRFIGGDRIGDTEQISVGLTSRLIDQSTGIEWLRTSFGQVFYLDDRYVTLDPTLNKAFLKSLGNPDSLSPALRDLADDMLSDESAYAAELALRLSENWRAQADLLYDEDDSQFDRGTASLRYKGDNNTLFNLSYRFNRRIPRIVEIDGEDQVIDRDIEQADISTMFPISRNWSLIGKHNYDLTNSRDLETFFGLQYESCCWRLSLLARRWLDRDDLILLPDQDLEEDDGIFFQIQFKGLAGSGSQVDSILEDGIYGYEPAQ
ncbi:MAG: LPS-assembly protein LptD [Gammaproteobacteria bacterium]|nr:MAG: LPS-assembly protein LptD [Gammaproteobacteria bacterium]